MLKEVDIGGCGEEGEGMRKSVCRTGDMVEQVVGEEGFGRRKGKVGTQEAT